MALSSLSLECVHLFDNISSHLQESHDKYPQISVSGIRDELGRFKVWGGNIGAFELGSTSLDYKLREASKLRGHVEKIVGELHGFLTNCLSIVSGERHQCHYSGEDDIAFDFGQDVTSITLDVGSSEWSSEEDAGMFLPSSSCTIKAAMGLQKGDCPSAAVLAWKNPTHSLPLTANGRTDDPTSELEAVFIGIKQAITSLFKMSILLKKPTPGTDMRRLPR